MTMTNGGDQTAQLTVLGTGRLPQPEGGPSVSLLEVFPNRFPHRPYVVSMAFPEYTSLCPVTGQPDFGTIVVEFIPAHPSFAPDGLSCRLGQHKNQGPSPPV